MLLELMKSISLLLSLSLVLAFVFYFFRRESLTTKFLSGCVYGFIAVLAMMMPFNFMPGFIFDPRSVILSLSGFFGGPVVAVIAATIASLYRYYLGGTGAVAGVLVILLCTATGAAYYYIRNRYQIKTRLWHFLVFGVLAHFVAIFGLTVLPNELMWKVAKNLSIPFFSIYPLATLFLGTIIHNINLYFDRGEELVKTRDKLQKQSELLQKQVEDLKQTEKSLKESEERFKSLADNSPLAIYASSGIEQIAEYINPTFVKLFGYTIDEVPNVDNWWPLAYPDEKYRDQLAEEWQKKVDCAIKTKSEIEPMETVVTCKDGSTRNVLWGYSAAGNQNYAIGLDLTDRKQAEERLRKSAETLRANNAELAQFNRAMVGRELRMIELKEEINELCCRLGEPLRYGTDQLESEPVPGGGDT